jgi:hypothetical protein
MCTTPDPDDDDGGYGDDFEDYDDDFDLDDDDASDIAPSSSRRSSSSSNIPKLAFMANKEDSEMKQIRKSMEMENNQAIRRQHNRYHNMLCGVVWCDFMWCYVM